MAEQLESPEQLPDIKGRKLVFTWDQEEADSVVKCGETLVWRERTGWEVYQRFGEIAVILQRKYKARIKDLVPAPGSDLALYGDSSRGAPYVQAVRAQLATGKPKKYSWWGLEDLVRKSDVDGLRLYLFAGGYPSATNPNDGRTLLHMAARLHLPDFVRLLLKAGAKLNALDRDGMSPLREAIDVHAFDNTPAKIAARNAGALEIVRLLVDAGANTDGRNRPLGSLGRVGKELYEVPLALAARHGNLEVVRYLLGKGANVDLASRDGLPPLHSAIHYGQPDIVRVLIAAGADVNLPESPDKVTPLLRAVSPLDGKEHAAEMVRELVRAGANVNAADSDGNTPLLGAVNSGNAEVVSLLLAAGADIHRPDSEGDSPLASAVLAAGPRRWPLERMAPIVQALRAAGADPSTRNNEGKSARDHARELGLPALEALL